MHASDALRLLGLDEGASIDDVMAARRRLARECHPDVGGDEHDMVRVNQAAELLLNRLRSSASAVVDPSRPVTTADLNRDVLIRDVAQSSGARRWRVDRPSFTIDVLPAEAFEWLLLAARVLGDVVDDDPPYALEVLLDSRVDRWCRLEVVPDAGSSTVSIIVENVDPEDLVTMWVDTINELSLPATS